MKLALFDIDGTLTGTNAVDDESFIEAFAEAYQITDIETDWTKYRHVTDSGLVSEIFEKNFNRSPEAEEIALFKRCFVENLKKRAERDAESFVEVPNAKKMLEKLKLENDWAIALATGSFYESAALKVRMAKLNVEDFPIATADDAVSREEILRTAVNKAMEYYRQSGFEKIVSIGDGVWDVRTAKNLNLDFVGIAVAERADRLRREGASFIIGDFNGYESFIDYLNK